MKCFICAVLLIASTAQAARFLEPCEVHFTIEDGDIGENVIVEVLLDNKSILPSKTTFFDAKKVKVLLPEGVFKLVWKVRKKDFGKGFNEFETFERSFEIEKYDREAYINIRGKNVMLLSPGHPM